jgi:hypothetical protein
VRIPVSLQMPHRLGHRQRKATVMTSDAEHPKIEFRLCAQVSESNIKRIP